MGGSLRTEDLVRRVQKFQAALKPNEKMVLKVGGVSTDAIGVRGATIWFQGSNEHGCAVIIAQHYTQANVVLVAAPLPKGEKPRPIGFLTE
jgi:hypothetical protein